MKTFDNITPEMITEWKNKGKKKLTEISIPINENDLTGDGPVAKFVICQPDRNVLDACAKYSQEKNFKKANALMITNCMLGGDEKYVNSESEDYDVDIELALLDEIGKLIESKKTTVKKL